MVLVGHSYGGMVITGVADALQRERSGLLRHLVYVDGSAPRELAAALLGCAPANA